MSMQSASGFCKVCNMRRLIQRPGTNHILHLLMTVLTCGFWAIIWLLSSVKIGGWRCSVCGSKRVKIVF